MQTLNDQLNNTNKPQLENLMLVEGQIMQIDNQNQHQKKNSSLVSNLQYQENVQLKQILKQKIKLDLSRENLQYFGSGVKKKQWSEKEDRVLMICAQKYDCNWDQVVEKLPERNKKMCYSRYQRIKLQAKNPWRIEQNRQIKNLYQKQKLSWRQISFYFPNRTCKQIRQHYIGYLKKQNNSTDWTVDDDLKLIDLFNQHGTQWKKMENYFENRTENQIKNRYYGRLLKLQIRKDTQGKETQ